MTSWIGRIDPNNAAIEAYGLTTLDDVEKWVKG
jgi:hypothetical protein